MKFKTETALENLPKLRTDIDDPTVRLSKVDRLHESVAAEKQLKQELMRLTALRDNVEPKATAVSKSDILLPILEVDRRDNVLARCT
jgi:hypothetical protein